MEDDYSAEKDVLVTTKYVPQQILFSGFGGRKGLSSMVEISTAGVLRLRATSAVSRDKSVRRSAQDDDFVGVSTKNILNKLALMGRSPGLSSGVPAGLSSERWFSRRLFSPGIYLSTPA
jgi:hypothetical protein